jgi:arabinosaccharide transport system substrate-binding protein
MPLPPFPLGRPAVVMLAVALACGGLLLLRPAPRGADLTVWTFADAHADSHRRLAEQYTRATGRSVDVQVVPTVALNTRMIALFMSGESRGLPDAVELQMSTAGPYFRPPVDHVGLLPLNHYLETTGLREIADSGAPGWEGWHARSRADGKVYTFRGGRWTSDPSRARPDAWIDRIVPSRLAAWSKGGAIFGLPHDVHPVTLTYRHDLWWADPQTGRGPHLDPALAKTWAEFHEICLRFQAYWRGQVNATHPNGYTDRRAMELFESSPDQLNCLLLQRGIDLVDGEGRLHLTDLHVAETITFYASLIAGPDRVAAESSSNPSLWAQDLADGRICALLTPDWRVNDVRRFAPALAGKLRMIPLPRFDPADPPTSTWDGTMIGIPREAKRPDEAWRLIEALYLSDAGVETRYRETNILPPLRDAWSKPVFHEPDAFFGGQRTGEIFISLADQVPDRHVHWATPTAMQALGFVLYQARGYLDAGKPVEGLHEYVSRELRRADAYVRRVIEHGPKGRS